jgi:hypothetical protein
MPFFSRTSNATIFRSAPFDLLLSVDISALYLIDIKAFFSYDSKGDNRGYKGREPRSISEHSENYPEALLRKTIFNEEIL